MWVSHPFSNTKTKLLKNAEIQHSRKLKLWIDKNTYWTLEMRKIFNFNKRQYDEFNIFLFY